MKKILVIGGGHGLSTILKGIKNIEDIEISCIVTVADNGGSTGRLRKLYNVPAMGDIRNVIVSLAQDEDVIARLLDYRFDDDKGEFSNHNLGNLMILALSQLEDSFNKSINLLSKILKIKGKVYPSTNETVDIYALMEDGSIVKGESSIPQSNKRIEKIFYDHQVNANYNAIKAINEADYIIYGIGSLYTSIIPNIIIPAINKAIEKSKAKKIYFLNCMTQQNETDNYTLKDHFKALLKHGAKIDLIIKHNEKIPEHILEKYKLENSIEVEDDSDGEILVKEYPLLEFKNDLVRHSSEKIANCIIDILKEN